MTTLNPQSPQAEKRAARLIIAYVLEGLDADQTIAANPELLDEFSADPSGRTLFEVIFNLVHAVVQLSAAPNTLEDYVGHLRQLIAEVELAEMEAHDGHT